MSKELLQQALDALLSARHAIRNLLQGTAKETWPKYLAVSDKTDVVREQIAAALAAPQPEPVAHLYDDGTWIATQTAAGRSLNDRMLFAGSPKIGVYTVAAPPAAPADMVMVPREPTPEMVKAFQDGMVHEFGMRTTAGYHGRIYRAMISAAPAHAVPANPWKAAIDDELVCCHIGTTDSFSDAKAALKNLIDWHVSVALDPAVSSDAQALIDQGKSAAPAVPLTDEQIRSIYSKTLNQSLREQDTSIVLQFASAIEQAHGIGGGGK